MGAFHASGFKDVMDMRPEDVAQMHAAEVTHLPGRSHGTACTMQPSASSSTFESCPSLLCVQITSTYLCQLTCILACRSCVCTRRLDARYVWQHHTGVVCQAAAWRQDSVGGDHGSDAIRLICIAGY